MASARVSIAAVAVDLGGVLFEDGTRSVMQALAEKYPHEQDVVREIYTGRQSWDLRCGRIDASSYWQMVAQRYRDTEVVQHEDVRRAWYDRYQLRPAVFQSLLELRSRGLVGAISVNIADRIEFLERKYGFRRAFAFEVYSFEVGATKLEPALYHALQKTVARFGLRQQQVLMVDDHQDCLEQASNMGFATALAADVESFNQVLDQHGLR